MFVAFMETFNSRTGSAALVILVFNFTMTFGSMLYYFPHIIQILHSGCFISCVALVTEFSLKMTVLTMLNYKNLHVETNLQ